MRKRTKIVVYVSPDEKKLIQMAAAYVRRPVSNFVKNAAMSEALRNRHRWEQKGENDDIKQNGK